jgi:hypothetical protein
MEYFTPWQQNILRCIYSEVLKKNLSTSELEQLYSDEKSIIYFEYLKGRDYFKTLFDFWNCFLTDQPFIYFP